jgi:hypothetical protein
MLGDLPDRWRYAGMKPSANALFCCPECLCPHARLGDCFKTLKRPYRARTTRDTRKTLLRAAAAHTVTEARTILKQQSLTQGSVRIDARGHPRFRLPTLDPAVVGTAYRPFENGAYDQMHIQTGIGEDVFEAILVNIEDVRGNKGLVRLDRKFRAVPRFPGLVNLTKGGAVSRSTCTCDTWMSIFQVNESCVGNTIILKLTDFLQLLPFMVVGTSVNDDVIKLTLEMATLFTMAKQPRITSKEAHNLQRRAAKWVSKLKLVFGDKINTDTPKFHLFGCHMIVSLPMETTVVVLLT